MVTNNQTDINKYDRQERIKGWDTDVINNARILVVGAGTTGNEVIKNLCLLGIGQLDIIDFDDIEEVNLNRCVLFNKSHLGKPKAKIAALNAKKLNPECKIHGYKADVIFDFGPMFFKSFHCVIMTVDNLEARMWVNRYCLLTDVPLIDTGIEGLTGNVFVRNNGKKFCLECGWNEENYKKLSEKYSCLKIGLNLKSNTIPMVITTAAIIGGFATQECIRILHGKTNLFIENKENFHWYTAENTTVLNWSIAFNPNCLGHASVSKYNLSDFEEISVKLPINNIKELLKSKFNTEIVELKYDKEFIYSTFCKNCGFKENKLPPTFLGKFERYKCQKCGEISMVPYYISSHLEGNFCLADLKIPIGQLVIGYYELDDSIKEITLIITP